jgi:3-oxosteroid 1-dehydrogenase
VKTDNTIGDLASRIRIDPGALTATVDRWNSLCRSGRDSDFGRGESLYDRYYGDPRLETSPNLGTIEQAPFYAAPITSGTIGSKGGPVTTTEAQVVEHDGHPRRGWYAAGNAAASWTGDDYPAPGSTLGIGMTFAHRAAIAAIRSLDESPSWSS